MSGPLRIEDLDYDLPSDRIAQEPLADRASARLLVARRGSPDLRHATIRDLPRLLPKRTLLVLNDTRVIRARLLGRRASTGGKVELLLVRRIGRDGKGTDRWKALMSTRGRPRAGERLAFDGIEAELIDRGERGEATVDLRTVGEGPDLDAAIERTGLVPLPPYIRRPPVEADSGRYQTVYARVPGAVAAPTAGLHFTRELIREIEDAGHETASVTLHVGPGTFRPIETERIGDHEMHPEWIDVPEGTSRAIARAREEGRTVLAVGTTVVRALETAARNAPTIAPFRGDTSIFVVPGHRFGAVDAILTNFHLPRSTLLALVMAFLGVDETRAAYAEAVVSGYRFYSYGDAMLILPGLNGAGEGGQNAGGR